MIKNCLSLERIRLASRSIDPVFRNTPLIRHDELDLHTGVQMFVKVETLNPIRSFKGRGADFFVQHLPRDVGPLVAASAGNFGQGLAHAARKVGVPLTVFAPATANAAKVNAMRRLGAAVRLEGADLDVAKEFARAHADSSGSLFVEDGSDPAFAEGAGTIASEITEANCQLDGIIVSVGNGALVTGIGAWMKYAAPQTRVIGVVAKGAPAMQLSFVQKRMIQTKQANTIADGIAVRIPVAFALDTMHGNVDEVLAVSDKAMLRAMRLIHNTLGIVVEPAGVAGVAAVLAASEKFQGQRIATVLCGANLTATQTRNWLLSDS